MRISTRPSSKEKPDKKSATGDDPEPSNPGKTEPEDKDPDEKRDDGAQGDDAESSDDSVPGFTTTFHRTATRDIRPLPSASDAGTEIPTETK
jgi:hypothetical protein